MDANTARERGTGGESGMVGFTKDAGFQIGVSRTLRHPPRPVWDFVTGDQGVALWLGAGTTLPRERGGTYRTGVGTVGEVRSYHEGERLRITWRPGDWRHDSIVQVTVQPTAAGATRTTCPTTSSRNGSASTGKPRWTASRRRSADAASRDRLASGRGCPPWDRWQRDLAARGSCP